MATPPRRPSAGQGQPGPNQPRRPSRRQSMLRAMGLTPGAASAARGTRGARGQGQKASSQSAAPTPRAAIAGRQPGSPFSVGARSPGPGSPPSPPRGQGPNDDPRSPSARRTPRGGSGRGF